MKELREVPVVRMRGWNGNVRPPAFLSCRRRRVSWYVSLHVSIRSCMICRTGPVGCLSLPAIFLRG